MDYALVVCDLRQKAREINQAADVLESMIQGGGITRGPHVDVAIDIPPLRAHKTVAESILPPPKKRVVKPPANGQPTIRDLIRNAITENKDRTPFEICDEVQRHRPNADRSGISTQIGQLVITGFARRTIGGLVVPAASEKH